MSSLPHMACIVSERKTSSAALVQNRAGHEGIGFAAQSLADENTCVNQLIEVNAGINAHAVHHVDQIFGGDVPGCARCERTAAEAAERGVPGVGDAIIEPVGAVADRQVEIARGDDEGGADRDDGDELSLQLFYETSGSGIIGWVRYDVPQQARWNVSIDPEEPQALKFDRRFAQAYASCLEAR